MNDKKNRHRYCEAVATAQEFVENWRPGEAGEPADEPHIIEGGDREIRSESQG